MAQGGTTGALRLRQIKKLYETKSHWRLFLVGVPLVRKINSKILVSPMTSPAFQPRFLRPWVKNQSSAPNIFLLILLFSKRYDSTPCSEILGRDRFGRKVHFWHMGMTP